MTDRPPPTVPNALRCEDDYGRMTHIERINGRGNPADDEGAGAVFHEDVPAPVEVKKKDDPEPAQEMPQSEEEGAHAADED